MKQRYTFWCGWEVDDSIPERHKARKWPANMRGWSTGFGAGFSTWVGRVDAFTAAEAKRVVRGLYGESARKIRMRWEPEQKELGYRPGERFPE